jgi:predicted AlkP superfamily phosphohydrolase/phosphomutase
MDGIMVSGPVFISGEKQIFPPELGGKYELPEMGGMTEFPAENELEQFLEMTLQSTKELANFGLDLLGNEDWDLYFISFFTLDRLQHFLWRFWDTSDPFYPGPSKLEGAIRKAYKMYDEIVGSFLAGLDEKTAVMVLSDHGHGQRPTKLFNLNEYLRQAGLLKTPERKNQRLSLKKSIEFVKNMSVRLVVKVLGESWLYRIGRLLPKHMRKALKKSSYLIDKENSLAWASELGGGASVGGVIINPRIASGSEQYRDIADKISELLEQINDSSYGRVVQWAKVQHEVNHYPDVIFELDPRFSVGRSFFCPIVEKNPRHKITSGGHKKEGILFTHNCQELHTKVSTMEDISNGIISFVLDQ